MTTSANIVTGLDIGTAKVTVLVAEIIQKPNSIPDINIIGIGNTSSSGLRKGVVINIEATVQSIASALQQAEAMAGTQIKSVFASISGSHLKSFNSNGIVPIKNKEVRRSDIEKVIEAARAVAIPLDREILHVLPHEFIVDDQDGIREPLGISGVRLEAKVHIVTGATASAQNIVKCANRCGLSVADIVLAPYAAARAVMSAEEQDLGVCVVDIGGGTTDLVIFRNGAINYSSVLPVGGNHIMNDIANVLRTPVASAEYLKCNYGAALVADVDVEQTIEVPSTGGRESRTITIQVLNEIINSRVEEIFNLVVKDLVSAGQADFLAGGIVLTGGSTRLPKIVDVAERIFKLPVRIGKPTGVVGLVDLVNTPEYATAVGLVKFGAHLNSLSHYRTSSLGLVDSIKRLGNWLGRHF